MQFLLKKIINNLVHLAMHFYEGVAIICHNFHQNTITLVKTSQCTSLWTPNLDTRMKSRPSFVRGR